MRRCAVSIRDDSREREWRPGLSSNIVTYRERTSAGPVIAEVDKIFTQCRAMPRLERTHRLQDAFVTLADLGIGLRREQEMILLRALEATP